MKRLGFSGEEVYEIGKLKRIEAFIAHYQMLEANFKLKESLSALRHNNTSIGISAEPEMSRTSTKTGE